MTNTTQWTQDVALLAEIATQEDNCCLQMGDHLNVIEKRWGRNRMKPAAQEAGVTWALARQRSWVSKRIPPGDPLRETKLSYSHLRQLANTDDPMKWGNLVLANNWTVATLKDEIDKAGDRKALEDGLPCIYCEKPISNEVISLRIGQEKPTLYCSLACVIDMANRLIVECRPRAAAFQLDDAFSL